MNDNSSIKRILTAVGVVSTLGLFGLLSDPEEGSSSGWSQISPRARGVARFTIGFLFIMIFSGFAYYTGFLKPNGSFHELARLLLSFFGFGGVLVMGWGAASILSGKNFGDLGAFAKGSVLLLTGVFGFYVLMFSFSTGMITDWIRGTYFIKSFDPAYVKIREHAIAIDKLVEANECVQMVNQEEFKACHCEMTKKLSDHVDAVEELVQKNPSLENFEATFQSKSATVFYDLMGIRSKRPLYIPRDCN